MGAPQFLTDNKRAVSNGLDFLVRIQNPEDGGFYRDYEKKVSNIGVTALAGLAFMQNGSMPDRGKYGKSVRRCLDYILKNSFNDNVGYSASGFQVDDNMYDHG